MTLEEELLSADGKILIYGAHLVALECCRYLTFFGKGGQIVGFAVTDMTGNPEELDGFPVKAADEYSEQYGNLTVIIAMPGKYHDSVEKYAKEKGVKKFVKVGLEEMSLLKGTQLLSEQHIHAGFPFLLEKTSQDGSWLNIRSVQEEPDRYYKFPTLFYIIMKNVLYEAEKLDFQKDYQNVLGSYRSIHSMRRNKGIDRKSLIRDIIQVYMVFSGGDSALLCTGGIYDPWICPLQAGGRDSRMEISCEYDDTGETIADKNHLFAEMTGAYWIWKNVKDVCYKGLCHYRRHFVISEEEVRGLLQNKIDVVLTIPRYVPFGIGNMFLAETPVKNQVLESVVQAVRERSPGDEISFQEYLRSCFYYPNNMVIAKTDIYDAYCKWVFLILFRTLDIETAKCYGHTDDRHLAYASELLTSFYFAKNKDKYCIAVSDYQFYS